MLFRSLMPNMLKVEPPVGTLAGTQVPAANAEEPAASRLTAATVSKSLLRILDFLPRKCGRNAITRPHLCQRVRHARRNRGNAANLGEHGIVNSPEFPTVAWLRPEPNVPPRNAPTQKLPCLSTMGL